MVFRYINVLYSPIHPRLLPVQLNAAISWKNSNYYRAPAHDLSLPFSKGIWLSCVGRCRQQRGFRRRSEVDRRLDTLVAGNGKLRESGSHSIIRMLRLFNLCDLGTSSHDAPADKVPSRHPSLPVLWVPALPCIYCRACVHTAKHTNPIFLLICSPLYLRNSNC